MAATLAALVVAMLVLPVFATAATTTVTTRAQLQAAVSAASPGDEIIIANGVWTNERIILDGTGSAQAPILVRAQTPGQVVLTGQSSLEVRGRHVIVEGLHFRDGYLTSGHVVRLRGSNQTLRHTLIDRYNNPDREVRYFWVSLSGPHHTVEENTFRGMNHSGVTVVVWRDTTAADYAVIRRNYFVDRPQGTANGWEMIRIGTSARSLSDSYSIIEENLFERCDGEVEIISNKSGRNIYRGNTFRASRGCLTLRHGDNCVVDSNFFFGEHVTSTGGIRVIGEGHLIVNNYIEGTRGRSGAAISINSGLQNSSLGGYFAAHRAVVAFNTIVDVSGSHITLSEGNRAVPPEDVIVANNIMEAGRYTSGSLVTTSPGPRLVAQGNIGHGRPRGTLPASGITLVDPRLALGEDSLWRPDGESPVLGAALGSYPQVQYDMDGQPRGATKDVGADERSDAPILNRPLTPWDVGAPWARDPEPLPGVVFEDTFDDHPAGSPPAAPWTFVTQVEERGTILAIADEEDRFGGGPENQLLEWRKDGPANGVMRLDAIPAFSAGFDYKVVTFSFDHIVAEGSGEIKFFVFHDPGGTATSLSDPGGNLVQRIRINAGRLGESYVYPPGELIRADIIVNNSAVEITHTVRGQEFVVPAGHYQTWVDGMLAVAATVRNNAQFNRPITHFRFETSSGDRALAWFDNFTVFNEPRVRESGLPSFYHWLAEHFTPEERDDEAVGGPLGDGSGGGLPNLLVYALGGNPRIPDRSVLPVAAIQSFEVEGVSGEYLTLTFQRPADRTDLLYRVAATSDLDSWPDEAVRVSAGEVDGTVTELWRDSQTIEAADRRVLRLEVSLTSENEEP